MRRLVMVGMAAAMACQCPREVPPERGTPRLVRDVDGVRAPIDEVDFGALQRGDVVEVLALLENVGAGRLVFERAESVGGSEVLVNGVGSVGAPFSVTISEGALEPGATTPVSVVFRGSANARETGVVHLFFSNSTIEVPLVLTLKALPRSSCERAFFAGLDFGGVEVGDDVRLTLDVANPTPRSLEVALTDFPVGSAFRVENDLTRLSVAPGEVGTFVVHFNPLSEGLFLDEVTLVDACGPTRAKLLGTGMRGALRASPSPLDFGFSPLSTTKDGRLTLQNFGARPVTVRQLLAASPFSVVNPAAMLAVPGASRDPRTSQLEPGTLDVPLRFTPSSLGRVMGQLTMATSLRAQPTLAVPLAGTGGAPVIDVPAVLDLGRVAFAPFQQGVAWALLPVKNLGSQPLEFPAMPTTVTAANPESREADLCVGEFAAQRCQPAVLRALQPGETFDLPITVAPSSLVVGVDGSQSWDVELTSNDPRRPRVTTRVRVLPRNLPPCLATASGPLDFGVVSEVLPKERAFRFCNAAPPSSMDQCLVSRVDVLPGARDTFSIDAPVSDRLLGPGECLSVTVTARQAGPVPAQPTTVVGALRVVTSGSLPMVDVPLRATQAVSCLVVDPTPLDFGPVTVGCQSVERTVRLFSRCGQPVVVSAMSVVDDGAAGVGGPPRFSLVTAPSVGTLPGCDQTLVGCRTQGAAVNVQLRYRPDRAGSDLGALRIVTTQGAAQLEHVLVVKGEGVLGARVTDQLPVGTPRQADVVLLIDGSPSFDLLRPIVGPQLQVLADWAVDAGVDARLAATVISEVESNTCRQCGSGRFNRTDAGAPFVSTSATDFAARAPELLVVSSSDGREDFSTNVLDAFSAPRIFGSNAGVLRAGASLGVLTVWDYGQLGPDGPALLPALSAVKGANRSDLLTVSVVTRGLLGPAPDSCGQLPLPPDPLVTATSSAQANYCTAGMGPALASVAPAVFGRRDRVWLRGTPAPAGIASVVLGGAPLPATLWRYDAATNTVVLEDTAVPRAPGSTLDVTYELACLPP